jgi:isopentenyl-diphosphate delta-isomerase
MKTSEDGRLGFLPHPYVQPHGAPGDSDEECFDVLGPDDRVLGQQPRSAVHAAGLWHRSVYVWVFDADLNVLLQRRAASKDVCPGLWDLSCAEHLQTGEQFVDGARRGLFEELHIDATHLPLSRLRSVHSQSTIDPGLALFDRERVETWGVTWNGPCRADPGEVAGLRFVAWAKLCHEIQAAPQTFTPWLRQEVAWFGDMVPWPASGACT